MIDKRLTDQFLELVEENKKLIYKVSHLFGDQSMGKGDLFQEIIFNLWKAYPNFKGNSKASTWIYRISINTAVSWMRDYEKNGRYIEYRNVIPHVQDEPEMDELHERLHHAIACLGKLDKALVLLQLDGYSYDEISEIIGLTKTNVATKLNRIKLKLKNHLSNN
jgi:RNA polymerase sigma-70 factor (ECF subfamily)